MTGLEILIAVIATIWVLKNAFVDGAFAVRGQASPRLAARLAGRQGRYGPIKYLGDSLSDFWRGMRERREARMAGLAPPPRQQGWLGRTYGRMRGRITGWWDNATTRVDNRRQAEAIRGEERKPASRWQRFTDRLMGRDASAWPAVQRRPGEDFTGRPLRNGDDGQPPKAGQDKPEPKPAGEKAAEPEADKADEKPANGHTPVDLNGAPARTPIGDPAERAGATDHPRAQGAGEENQKENGMAEVTGLGSAIAYAGGQAESAQQAVTSWEQFISSLNRGEVSGTSIAAAQRAMEAQQVAAQAAQEAHDTLSSHTQVTEAYQSTDGAGTREFVTTE